ncbi:MAG: winged helix-turn-helix transcriptional regulator [Nanoarchaeota archaeon]
MAMLEKSIREIMKILLKDFTKRNTISSLSEEIGIERPGVWKVLKRLESKRLINLDPIGKGKTSVYEVTLNWKNSLVEKTLAIILEEDALEQERWRDNFKNLEKRTLFVILFGSILHSPKEANDIDILVVVKTNNDFKAVEKIVSEVQQTQIKKIHVIDLTKEELKSELKKKNKAYLEALKKGAILFGQENFIKFVEKMLK